MWAAGPGQPHRADTTLALAVLGFESMTGAAGDGLRVWTEGRHPRVDNERAIGGLGAT